MYLIWGFSDPKTRELELQVWNFEGAASMEFTFYFFSATNIYALGLMDGPSQFRPAQRLTYKKKKSKKA